MHDKIDIPKGLASKKDLQMLTLNEYEKLCKEQTYNC